MSATYAVYIPEQTEQNAVHAIHTACEEYFNRCSHGEYEFVTDLEYCANVYKSEDGTVEFYTQNELNNFVEILKKYNVEYVLKE